MYSLNNSKSNTKKSSKKSNKFGTILIIALFLILSFLIFKIYKNVKASQPTTSKQDIVVKNKTKQEIEQWNEKVSQFQSKINQSNKLLVLEGSTDITVTYDNKEFTGSDNTLAWMKNKLNSLVSKTLTIDTEYKFGYAYDLSWITITNTNAKVHIKINQGGLQLKYVEEDRDKTVLSNDNGIFAKQFTPQQVNALMGRTWVHTQNTIINNGEIRDKAMEYLQYDIYDMATGFGIDNSSVEMEVIGDGLLDNNEVETGNITYKN